MASSLLNLLHTVLFLEQFHSWRIIKTKTPHEVEFKSLNPIIYRFQTMPLQKIWLKMDANHQFFHRHQ